MISLLRTILLRLSRIPPALMLAGIVGLAFLATFLINARITAIDNASTTAVNEIKKQANQKISVVYATRDISEGDHVSADVLEERDTLTGRVPQDALMSSALAVGKIAKYGISAGQVISQHDLISQPPATGFESQLREGARAITFGVDNNSGVAGFVSPDSHVDIFALVGTGRDTIASPVLSDVQVVAVGQTFKKLAGSSEAVPTSSLTVSVIPEDAQKLMKAISASKLYVALRNPNDHSPIATVDVTSLFRKPAATAAERFPSVGILPPPLPPVDGVPNMMQAGEIAKMPTSRREVEVWFGSKRDVLSFEGR